MEEEGNGEGCKDTFEGVVECDALSVVSTRVQQLQQGISRRAGSAAIEGSEVIKACRGDSKASTILVVLLLREMQSNEPILSGLLFIDILVVTVEQSLNCQG